MALRWRYKTFKLQTAEKLKPIGCGTISMTHSGKQCAATISAACRLTRGSASAAVAHIPVIVTENDSGTADDTRRVEYIRRAVRGVAKCIKDGIDVLGYTDWSALDNFEWTLGYWPTFGLIAVDRATQQRNVKPGARRPGEIARANALEGE